MHCRAVQEGVLHKQRILHTVVHLRCVHVAIWIPDVRVAAGGMTIIEVPIQHCL